MSTLGLQTDPQPPASKPKPSSLLLKQQRKKQVKRLSQHTKNNIKQAISQYIHQAQLKQSNLLKQVDTTMLNLLESISQQNSMFQESNIHKVIEDKMVFSVIQKQLFKFIGQGRCNSEPQQQYNRNQSQRLQQKIEQLLIKEQKLKEQLSELKRKYKNKYPSANPLSLPLPSITVLSTRHQRQNKMLMEQNNILSNRLIELQSQASRYNQYQGVEKTVDYQNQNNQFNNNSNTTNQYQYQYQLNIQTLNQQIKLLKQQLSYSNQRLQQSQSQTNQTIKLLHEQTQRTSCETQRISLLSTTIKDYQSKISSLEQQLLFVKTKHQYLIKQNLQMQQLSKQMIRKQILNDIIKQLNQHVQQNKQLKQQLQNTRTKLITKDDELRNKQIYYIDKLDEYSLLSKNNYDQLVSKHNAQLFKRQQQLKQIITELKNKLTFKQQQFRNREESTIQLTNELQETKSNLKQLKKTNRKSIAKKNIQQKQLHEQTHLAQIRSYNEQISKFKSQYKLMKQTYHEKLGLLQSKNKILKEKFMVEIIAKLQRNREKNSKNQMVQVAENLVESFNNLIHKESIINRLNKELNQFKAKKQKGGSGNGNGNKQPKLQSIILLNSQIQQERIKMEKSMFQEKISISEQKLSKSQFIIKQLQLKLEESISRQNTNHNKIRQLQKSLKDKKQKQKSQPTESSQTKITQQQLQQWKTKYNQMRKLRDDIQLQLKIKKDALAHLKSTIKTDQTQTLTSKKLNQQLRQQLQKYKKSLKQYQRKQQSYKDLKQKIQSIKLLQKQNTDLKQSLQQKSKQFKQQLSKKDFIIKLHKDKQKQNQEKLKDLSMIQIQNNQIKNLQDRLEKQRMENDRKDSLVKVYKDKLEKIEDKMNRQIMQLEEKVNQSKMQLIKENKKTEQLKFQVKKYQSDLYTLRALLKKINNLFKEVTETTKAQKTKNKKKCVQEIPNLDMYSEGLSILNLNVEEIQHHLTGSKETQVQPKVDDFKSIFGRVSELIPLIAQALDQ